VVGTAATGHQAGIRRFRSIMSEFADERVVAFGAAHALGGADGKRLT
jgi:hypothetical protein